MHIYIYTPGWWLKATPLKKYDIVNWDDEIPNIRKNKKCPKPPTRVILLSGNLLHSY